MKRFGAGSLLALLCVFTGMAAEFPEAEISNGLIHAKLLLPDLERGYYRGTRFDWSGVISSLTYEGHDYFGPWFRHYDPKLHDAIMGPVDEFRDDEDALGYAEAKPGGFFIKIGVGVLRKPDDAKYNFARTYELVNPGRRVVRPEDDRVEFVHELTDGEHYAYVYRKTVRLARNKPELILDHALKNTGRRTIEISVYNHDFYVIDGQPSGPEFVIKFAFPPRASDTLKGLAEIRGHDLVYKQELRAGGESIGTALEGFSDSAKDNDIRVENRKTGAGVREIEDRPISKLYFWSIRSTVCPEAYINVRVEPGHELKWRIKYEFYTLPNSQTK
jgi:hypothetical protein